MMNSIPAKPMQRILAQYVADKKLPFRVNRPEELIRAFNHYRIFQSQKN